MGDISYLTMAEAGENAPMFTFFALDAKVSVPEDFLAFLEVVSS